MASVSALAESLVARGHEVSVYTTNSNLDQDLDVPTGQMVDVQGVQVRYFKRDEPLKRYLPWVKYLSQSIGIMYTPDMAAALLASSGEFDLMHTHTPYVYPTFAVAKAARRDKVPLFYHQRGAFDPQHMQFRAIKKRAYISLVEKPMMRQAATLVALTETERANYAALGLRTPCRIVPNGIHLPAPTEPGKYDTELQSLGIKPHHKVVLFLGRLHPGKGADRLLAAFERVAPQHPDALLVLAGPDENRIEAGFVERSRAVGLAQRVIFPGMVSGERKAALLHRADLFCLPSAAEGFSMALLEALANATAVLISPGCNFPDVATANAGLIVMPTVDALERSMLRLLNDPAEVRAMGEAGRALVASKYTWDLVTTQMLDVYAEGVDRFHRRRQVS